MKNYRATMNRFLKGCLATVAGMAIFAAQPAQAVTLSFENCVPKPGKCSPLDKICVDVTSASEDCSIIKFCFNNASDNIKSIISQINFDCDGFEGKKCLPSSKLCFDAKESSKKVKFIVDKSPRKFGKEKFDSDASLFQKGHGIDRGEKACFTLDLSCAGITFSELKELLCSGDFKIGLCLQGLDKKKCGTTSICCVSKCTPPPCDNPGGGDVPEPAGFALLGLGMLAMTKRRRDRAA